MSIHQTTPNISIRSGRSKKSLSRRISANSAKSICVKSAKGKSIGMISTGLKSGLSGLLASTDNEEESPYVQLAPLPGPQISGDSEFSNRKDDALVVGYEKMKGKGLKSPDRSEGQRKRRTSPDIEFLKRMEDRRNLSRWFLYVTVFVFIILAIILLVFVDDIVTDNITYKGMTNVTTIIVSINSTQETIDRTTTTQFFSTDNDTSTEEQLTELYTLSESDEDQNETVVSI